MSESAHQIALFKWARAQRNVMPELRWMHAIPNGGHRSPTTAGRLKAEGVEAGVWDVFLPAPRHGKAGLYIEMKFGSNTLSPAQQEFGTAMVTAGYRCVVCHEWTDAKDAIVAYLYPPGKRVSTG